MLEEWDALEILLVRLDAPAVDPHAAGCSAIAEAVARGAAQGLAGVRVGISVGKGQSGCWRRWAVWEKQVCSEGGSSGSRQKPSGSILMGSLTRTEGAAEVVARQVRSEQARRGGAAC